MTVQFSVHTGLVALAAATAKTVVEMNPGASLPAELIAVTVSSSYVTTATPIDLLVELVAYTGTGTGTAYTPRRYGQAVGVALTAVKINDTVEPAGPTVVEGEDLVLPSGPYPYQWPLGREYLLSTSTFNGIRLTASAACSVRVNALFEE